MTFTLKSAIRTYELSLDDLKQMFADQLNVSAESVIINSRNKWVEYQRDGHHQFDGLKITVKEMK